ATGGHRLRIDGPPKGLWTLALAPDGRLLAAGGNDGLVRLWDVRTGREVGRLEGHQGAVTCLAFLPDGTQLISGSRDTTLLIWDLKSRVKRCRGAVALPGTRQPGLFIRCLVLAGLCRCARPAAAPTSWRRGIRPYRTTTYGEKTPLCHASHCA